MPQRPQIETEGDSVDWPGLEVEVVRKIHLLRAAWNCTERDAPAEVHAKMVQDLYLPCVSLLAEFCASVEEEDV